MAFASSEFERPQALAPACRVDDPVRGIECELERPLPERLVIDRRPRLAVAVLGRDLVRARVEAGGRPKMGAVADEAVVSAARTNGLPGLAVVLAADVSISSRRIENPGLRVIGRASAVLD